MGPLILAPVTTPLETFRFEDEDDYEYEISLEVFCVFSKYRLPGKLHFTIFH